MEIAEVTKDIACALAFYSPKINKKKRILKPPTIHGRTFIHTVVRGGLSQSTEN